MTTTKRALFLSHVPITPVIGGDRIRLFQILRLLAADMQVDVVCIVHHEEKRESLVRAIPGVASEKYYHVPRIKRYINAARTLFNKNPEFVNHYHHRRLQRYIDSVAGNYDVILCGSPTMASYFTGSGLRNVYVDFTDSLTLNYDNAAAVNRGWRKIWSRLNARRMRDFESRCRNEFRKTAYISSKDRNYIGSGGQNTCIIKNSVELPDPATLCVHDASASDIIFVGKMNYAPNIAACRYFAEEVFPMVRRSCPQARFVIVGMSPGEEVMRLARQEGVVVTGRVESPSDYYRGCAFVIAPMVSGSGLQNKILEAMAHGCCVVTTRIGASGFESDPPGLIICDDPDLMARSCMDLLANPDTRRSKGQINRRYVGEFYSEKATAEQFRHFICISDTR